MNKIRTEALSKTQINDIGKLVHDCQCYDKTTLTFPIEDGYIYFLLYDESMLLSALSVFFNEGGEAECVAFTDPSHRKQGCFSMLLEYLEKEADEYDIIFSADPSCADANAALNALEAQLLNHEYMMEYPIGSCEDNISYSRTSLPQLTITPPITDILQPPKAAATTETAFDTPPQAFEFLLNGSPIGSCLMELQGTRLYFYHFEILPDLREKGFGTACMNLLLFSLEEMEEKNRPKAIKLQVSGENEAAMKLYTKIGFQVTEQLAYYLY